MTTAAAIAALGLVLTGCASVNTTQQNLAYERWTKCEAPYSALDRVDPDGRITFNYSSSSTGQAIFQCLAAASQAGPPLPAPVGIRPTAGP